LTRASRSSRERVMEEEVEEAEGAAEYEERSSAPPPSSKGRQGLLSSINGFKKGALKKAVTVDKSKPFIEGKSNGGGGGGGGGRGGGSRGSGMMGMMGMPPMGMALPSGGGGGGGRRAAAPPPPSAPSPTSAGFNPAAGRVPPPTRRFNLPRK